MSISQLLADYGYLAVFAGCLLEGETILVLAGFAAHQGLLSLPVTLGIAFVAGTLGDQIFYWIGHEWGPSLMARFPGIGERAVRVNRLLHRWHAPLIIGIRFMYGLRIVGPIAIGNSGVAPWRFTFFNVVGAAIWAPLVGGAGYLFGHALEAMIGDLERFEEVGLVFIIVAGVVLTVVRHRLKTLEKRKKLTSAEPG
ncbi:MAG TPA: DedA family protein [Ramlibacter sp.]|nr:DedA family protein [Ramlibacter sp.]